MKQQILLIICLISLISQYAFGGKRIERDEIEFREPVTFVQDTTFKDNLIIPSASVYVGQIISTEYSPTIVIKPHPSYIAPQDVINLQGNNIINVNRLYATQIGKAVGNLLIISNTDFDNNNVLNINNLGTSGDRITTIYVATLNATSFSGDPTFTGNITINGTLDAKGNISDSLGDLTLDDNVDVTGILNAKATIQNSVVDLTLDDDVDVTGILDAQATIIASTGVLTLDDDVDVTGILDAQNTIIASTGVLTLNDAVAVTDTLDAQNTIYDSTGELTLNDAVIITGASDLRGDIQNTDGTSPVTFNDAHGVLVSSGVLDVRVDIEDTGDNIVTIDDNLVVTGTSDLRSDINNTTGAVVVDDAQGLVVDQGVLDVHGTIQNTDGTSPVTFNDAQGVLVSTGVLDVRVDIEDTGDNIVRIDDAVVVTGTLDAQGAIQNTTVSGKVTISDVDGINLSTVPAHADDATAGVAGLVTGDVYQTDGTGAAPLNVAGILMIKQ